MTNTKMRKILILINATAQGRGRGARQNVTKPATIANKVIQDKTQKQARKKEEKKVFTSSVSGKRASISSTGTRTRVGLPVGTLAATAVEAAPRTGRN